ncbi:DEAD/DEAH box helicase [Actinidia rufa]|uniref:DEAD/DEAH box helicase n=1 Tax=Actinidia rufa TaxID=165716 RepID=A0A7J0EPG8_9ERIC|nr:DEAD/DEAH box helicase [Actinidia rufa]
MSTLSILSLPHAHAFSPNKTLPFLHLKTPIQIIGLGFCRLKPLRTSPQFPASYKFPRSLFPSENRLSDADEEDDDDEEAADEYEDVSDEVSVDDEQSDDEFEGSEDDALEPKSRFEEFKWQRVERLRSEVREYGAEIIDVDELASIYDFRIDKFQRLAIQAFLRGSSVVVSAPTSSGKTLVAEAAAVATVARGKRLFYTTPLKALSNQKFREFRDTFGDKGVGLLTGDSAINKDAQVLIMTTEILRNMLYRRQVGYSSIVGMVSSESGLFHVDVIVLDEVHYLSDISRGTVWEEIVIYCPKEVQLICLSATVANPDELAGWIGQIHGKTELVTSFKRPVPLTWHFSTKTSLLPLLDEKEKSMNRQLSLNYLQLYSSGIIPDKDEGSRRKFSKKRESNISSNTNANMNRRSLSKNDINTIRRSQLFSILKIANSLDECEIGEVELALKRFRIQYPDAVRESSVKGLLRGAAAHHAGCLPLWKSFVEELFQRGLVKVVFATETLAAGINMPARTSVIASLSKRSESGRIQLSSNELLQMAGRAGRRGIDERGHVVLVQSAYEGAEQGCKILFSGLEPLVSQFTASYGMVLNLLAGGKITRRSNESDDMKVSQAGRTLEEARKLVEQSFGNYVGSNVMVAAKEELSKIQNEIEILTSDISDEAIDTKSRKLLTGLAYKEIADLQEELRVEKRVRTEMRRRMEIERMSALRPLLEELEDGHLPFMSLQYIDAEGVQHLVSAVYLGKMVQNLRTWQISSYRCCAFGNFSVDWRPSSNACLEREPHIAQHPLILIANFESQIPKLKGRKYLPAQAELVETLSSLVLTNLHLLGLFDQVYTNDSFALNAVGSGDSERQHINLSYYVALGSDNSWYLFTEKWIKALYKTGFPNVALAQGDALPREIMRMLLDKDEMQWQKLVDSELGGLWCMEGSLDTWSWSLNVPVLNSLSEDDEAYRAAVESFKDQRNKARANRLINRIEQIEPSGWKEFVKVSNVIHEARVLDVNTQMIFPLGETAAAIRGENELWLAMVLRNKILLGLKPAQFAAVCGSLVSEGIKVRPWKNNSYIYEPSTTVIEVINFLDEQRSSLLQLQEKHGVSIPCCLDTQFSGMVEAWASGLTWREIMMDCAMDDGDLARLLRRTIDLLAQIPKLPDIDPLLQSNAMTASNVMDRPPISELAG